LTVNQTIPNPSWLAGFVSGEGCFYVRVGKNSTVKTGFQVQPVFVLGQHIRDEILMNNIITFLECGKIHVKKNKEGFTWLEYTVSKFSDIKDKIMPFFQKHGILGVKLQDFNDWCKVVNLMKDKEHLTPEGLDKIFKIKAGINKGRDS